LFLPYGFRVMQESTVVCLNRELVRADFAWLYRRYAKGDTVLAGLGAKARAARRGLWADANPVPPWDYRRGSATVPATATGEAGRGSEAASLRSVTSAKTGGEAAAGTVYLTATGKKYHRAGCRYLSGGGTAATVKEATGRGLTPCKVCKP
jgi:Micrococcal nuclease (thermonuclease) homologs